MSGAAVVKAPASCGGTPHYKATAIFGYEGLGYLPVSKFEVGRQVEASIQARVAGDAPLRL